MIKILSFVICICIWFMSTSISYADESEPIAVLTNIRGKVEVKEAGKSSWRVVKDTTLLRPGDEVHTEDKSEAVILWMDEKPQQLKEKMSVKISPPSDLSKVNVLDQKDTKVRIEVFKHISKRLSQVRKAASSSLSPATISKALSHEEQTPRLSDQTISPNEAEELKSELSSIQELSEDQSSVRLLAASVYLKHKMYAKAESEIRQALKQFPDDGLLKDLLITVYQEASSKKWAIFIGVDKYEDRGISPLKYTVKDVEELYKIITTVPEGFNPDHVILMTPNASNFLHRPTRSNILSILESWFELAEKNDVILLYYSGHGIERDGNSYILPQDARISTLDKTAINVEDLRNVLRNSKAEKKY